MKSQALLSAACLVMMGSAAAFAHHSFVAEFDRDKPIKVSGIVTKVEWQNPHIWYYVDVKDESGKVTNWAFSGGAPNQLMRRGITREVIKPGMNIVVEGFRSRDGSNNAAGQKVTFQDGRSVFTSGGEEGAGNTKRE
jgi:hypothetical protein